VNSILGEEKETTIQSPLLVFFSPSQCMKSHNSEIDIEQALKVSNGGRGSMGYGRGRGCSGARRRGI